MLPIEEFAASENLTTDQVLEGVKAGIYETKFTDNQLYVALKTSVMTPIDEFARSNNVAKDEVFEGIKLGIYNSEYRDDQIYVSKKIAEPSSTLARFKNFAKTGVDKTTKIIMVVDKTTKIIMATVAALMILLLILVFIIIVDKQPSELQKAKIEPRLGLCMLALDNGMGSLGDALLTTFGAIQQIASKDQKKIDKKWKVKETSIGQIINVTFDADDTEFSCDFIYANESYEIHRVKRNGETVYDRVKSLQKVRQDEFERQERQERQEREERQAEESYKREMDERREKARQERLVARQERLVAERIKADKKRRTEESDKREREEREEKARQERIVAERIVEAAREAAREAETLSQANWRAAIIEDLKPESFPDVVSAEVRYHPENEQLSIDLPCPFLEGYDTELHVVSVNDLGPLATDQFSSYFRSGNCGRDFESYSGLSDKILNYLDGISVINPQNTDYIYGHLINSEDIFESVHVQIIGPRNLKPRSRQRKLQGSNFPPLTDYSILADPIRWDFDFKQSKVQKEKRKENLREKIKLNTPLSVTTPEYPRRAQTRSVEGYAVVEVIITTTGGVRDPVMVEEDPEGWGFGRAALKAASKLKYNPRVIDGVPQEVPGVLYKFTFQMAK